MVFRDVHEAVCVTLIAAHLHSPYRLSLLACFVVWYDMQGQSLTLLGTGRETFHPTETEVFTMPESSKFLA